MHDSYVITGATGFVGSFLTAHFIRRGRVLGIARRVPGLGSARCSFLQADITGFIPAAPAFAGSAIIHAAAVMTGDAATFQKVNVEGTIAVLEWAVRHECRHFVLFSSGGVYGYGADRRWSEDSPLNPIGDYGQSKRQAEDAALRYHRRYGLAVTVVRLFFPFGAGQTRGILPTITQAVRNGTSLTIHQNGAPRMNPVHGMDIATAIERLLAQPDGFQVFNLCGDEEVSFLELVRQAEQRHGQAAVLEFSREPRGDLLGDNRRLKSLGWTPALRVSA